MVTSVKGASRYVPASEVVFVRFAFGLLAVGYWAVRLVRRDGLHNTKLLVARGVMGGTAVLAYFTAIALIPTALASLLNYTSPLYTTLFGVLFLNERPQKAVLGFGALAMAGCVVVALGRNVTLSGPVLGYGLAALSAVGAGASIVAMRALGKSDHPVVTFSSLCLFGGLASLPLMGEWVWPTGLVAWAWLFVMALASLVAQLLFTFGLRDITASTAALSMQLSVGLTGLLSFVAFDEVPTSQQMAGSLLILLGVVGMVTHEWRRA